MNPLTHQQKIFVFVVLFLLSCGLLIIIAGDGGKQSRIEEQRQDWLAAGRDRYDDMDSGDLLRACDEQCKNSISTNPKDLSGAQRTQCFSYCVQAQYNNNENDFREIVRGMSKGNP